jgi:hypothetical protein
MQSQENLCAAVHIKELAARAFRMTNIYANRPSVRKVPVLPLQPRAQRTAHVHVDRDDLSAKFWLDPVALARNFGFAARELNTIESTVQANQQLLLEAWRGYFGDSGR